MPVPDGEAESSDHPARWKGCANVAKWRGVSMTSSVLGATVTLTVRATAKPPAVVTQPYTVI